MSSDMKNKNIDVEAMPLKHRFLGPFEWLTNYQSLAHLLTPKYLNDEYTKNCNQYKRVVLNIGCGTSTLGEELAQDPDGSCRLVINADCDRDALDGMEARYLEHWRSSIPHMDKINGKPRVIWRYFDFCTNFPADSSDSSVGTTFCDLLRSEHMEFKDETEECHAKVDTYFDLILDKGTLDCALCSDDAATKLLCHVYAALRPPSNMTDSVAVQNSSSQDGRLDAVDERLKDSRQDSVQRQGGIYFCVSFHSVELILPLLQNCPGVDWDVEHVVITRQLESMGNNAIVGHSFSSPQIQDTMDQNGSHETMHCHHSSDHVPNVHVFICRRRHRHRHSQTNHGVSEMYLDPYAVREHIRQQNDIWFQETCPMMTNGRENQLREIFARELMATGTDRNQKDTIENAHLSSHIAIPLQRCYELILTDEERENLEYQYFLEDWEVFWSSQGSIANLPHDEMTVETAIQFMKAMQ